MSDVQRVIERMCTRTNPRLRTMGAEISREWHELQKRAVTAEIMSERKGNGESYDARPDVVGLDGRFIGGGREVRGLREGMAAEPAPHCAALCGGDVPGREEGPEAYRDVVRVWEYRGLSWVGPFRASSFSV